MLASAASALPAANTVMVYGDKTQLGNGSVQTYVEYEHKGPIRAIGVEFEEGLLTNLPTLASDGNNCYDMNGDGQIALHGECMGGHQRILFLSRGTDSTPFRWVLMNWNTHGHNPPGIYTVPHFDFHFYIQDYVERNQIRPGPCSMLVNCDDYVKGKRPVPLAYMAPGYSDVDAVEVRMGNHLIDLSSPEFQPTGTFTHTFIFGSYDGKITFWEPMITKSFFETKPNVCTNIPLPSAYEVAGAYPTQYCIQYDPKRHSYRVSLEGMTPRTAQ